MEQKLICVEKFGTTNDNELKELLKTGWKITDISAAASNMNNYCWVLLERSTMV